MKKTVVVILMCFVANLAYADGHGGGRGGGGRGGGGRGGGWRGEGWRGDGWRGEGWREGWGGWGGWGGEGVGWVAPALIGGALGYALAQPQTVYVQPQTVYMPPPPAIIGPAGAYTGPPPKPLYQQVVEFSPQCNCNIQVLRQVGWQ